MTDYATFEDVPATTANIRQMIFFTVMLLEAVKLEMEMTGKIDPPKLMEGIEQMMIAVRRMQSMLEEIAEA